jgi:hypothetical protein
VKGGGGGRVIEQQGREEELGSSFAGENPCCNTVRYGAVRCSGLVWSGLAQRTIRENQREQLNKSCCCSLSRPYVRENQRSLCCGGGRRGVVWSRKARAPEIQEAGEKLLRLFGLSFDRIPQSHQATAFLENSMPTMVHY